MASTIQQQEDAIKQHEATTTGMHEVTEGEFFRAVRSHDVHPSPVGPYPYRSDWKNREGELVGRSIPVNFYGSKRRWFLVRKLRA